MVDTLAAAVVVDQAAAVVVEHNSRIADLKERLLALAKRDAECVFKKDVEYGHSWRKRGGVGAFFVIARKWDRLEERLRLGGLIQYDLFEHIAVDNREEGIIDDVRDLRQYLLLVEETMMARGALKDILEHSSARSNSVRGGTDHPHPFGYDPVQDDPPMMEQE